ncbi:LppX_LprAFG lipoprotein [Intrasporangium sp. YIM S08009]|uniref:LppX_LprAFG lipoprotein n=1 Tax=Intrasporangium zincisolvens TaxID=3080018 RepID=UPI002B0538BF|nr:LppX_LprAFG lipoprotein [Intrasporangium sp. YIM S08009]
MKWNLRRTAAALILVPTVLGVAACGKTETPTATGANSTAPASAGTTTTTSAPADAGGPYKDKASFIAALKKGATTSTTAHVTMTMQASGQQIQMVGDTKVDPGNPAMKVSMDMGSQMKLDMILVDKKIYMKGFPGLQAGKWAAIDSTSTMGKQLTSSLDQADPTKMYDQFDKAVTDVKYVGQDSVDGQSMDKYELTLDTSAIEGADAAAKGQMPKTITYTAWLDDQDHLRRVTFDISGAKADMHMSKYGEPVDITAPAAKDTVKAPM